MGEIADALRRAKSAREQNRRTDVGPTGQSADRRSDFPPLEELTDHEPELGHVDESAKEPEPAAAESFPPRDVVTISREKTGQWPARSVLLERTSGIAENYRHVAIRLRREIEARGNTAVMVGSALRLEGKTTTSCNLAFALASMAGGRRTALVDLDLRRPSVGSYLEARAQHGLEQALMGQIPLDLARVQTDLPSLDLYLVAEPMRDPHQILAGPALPALLAQLQERYDLVVLDSPPVMLVPDAELILPHVAGCALVCRSRQTRRAAFLDTVKRLGADRILGVLLNDARGSQIAKKHYSYYLEEDASTD